MARGLGRINFGRRFGKSDSVCSGKGYLWLLYYHPDIVIYLMGKNEFINTYYKKIFYLLDQAIIKKAKCKFCGESASAVFYQYQKYSYNGKSEYSYRIQGFRCQNTVCYDKSHKCSSVSLKMDNIKKFKHKRTKGEFIKLILEQAGFDTKKRFSEKRLVSFFLEIYRENNEANTALFR